MLYNNAKRRVLTDLRERREGKLEEVPDDAIEDMLRTTIQELHKSIMMDQYSDTTRVATMNCWRNVKKR
jgi:hypothetical protein